MRNNCVFSGAAEPVQNKIPKKGTFSKKVTFFWEFSRMYFPSCFLFLVMFLHCAFWVVHDVRLGVRKNAIFSIRCFLALVLSLRRRMPYLFANRLEPRISRDQHIQTCQFKTTNVEIHPAVPKVYTHLISFGQVEMANVSENFGNSLVGLKPWNDVIHDFRISVQNVFSGIWKKFCFFGPRLPDDGPKKSCYLAGWLAIWLARWLPGYLTIGLVAAWLAFGLLAIWLAD